MEWALKEVHEVGTTPDGKSIVEVETVGGFVMQVDPQTRTATETRQQFVVEEPGGLTPLAREKWGPVSRQPLWRPPVK